MSIRKIKNKGEVCYEVDLYTNGRQSKRLRRRFKRKIDAIEFLKNYLSESKNFKTSGASLNLLEEVYFKDELIFWFENSRHQFSASHIKRCEGIIKEILPIFGSLTLDKLTAARLTHYQRELKLRGQANATVNRKVEVILTTLNHSLRHRRIPYNPSTGYKKMNPRTSEMEFWNAKEASSFLSFAKEKYYKSEQHWIYVVYLLALNTGLRAGEVWGLRPIDIEVDTLFIRRQFNMVTQSFDLLKGKRNSKSGKLSRRVPCNRELFKELHFLIKDQKIQNTETLFLNKMKRPIDHNNFKSRYFIKDIKQWGGSRIRFHDLRHTAITQMIALGIDIKTVQSIAGHEDIKTTMNYVHVVGSKVKEVSKLFSLSANTDKKEAQILRICD